MAMNEHPLYDIPMADWPWKGFLCGNCTVVAANDDRSGVDEKDPEPLGLVPDGIYVMVACCDPQECTFDHTHLPHLDDQVDCAGCGSKDNACCPAIGMGH